MLWRDPVIFLAIPALSATVFSVEHWFWGQGRVAKVDGQDDLGDGCSGMLSAQLFKQ